MTDGELVARARGAHVVVIGGGVAGLVSALECAKVGMRVTVLEAADRLGGAIRTADVGGLTLDVGAESYATRGGHVRALIEKLGLGSDIVSPAAAGAWLAGIPGVGAARVPRGGVLGIPENPFAADVRRVLGWPGVWRAYMDRVRPVLTIGHQHSLGALVRGRMGERVLDRLVAPVVQGVYSAEPDDIDVDVAAPGLNAALTRIGSLGGAVGAVRGDRSPLAPGAAVEGIAGGMSRLVVALADRLEELGATVRTGVAADGLERADGEDGWRVRVLDAGAVLDADAAPDADADAGAMIDADAVIVAAEEVTARALLAPVVPGLAATAERVPPVVEVVTLVLDAPVLDAAPRGTGVLTVPGSHRAKALTHATAKWEWVAERAAAEALHRHVVRVSFGAQGDDPATAGLSESDAVALALAEASALLGVALEHENLVAGRRERYAQSQPASVIGRTEAVAADRRRIAEVDGLAAVGAWLAGTGLAQVVPDAVAEAERVRRRALWA